MAVRTVTIHLQDQNGDPVPNALARITLNGTQVALALTNLSGTATVLLEDGTYAVVWRQPAYVFSNPYTLTVDGDTEVTMLATKIGDLGTPEDVSLCRCWMTLHYVEGGEPVGAGEGSIEVTDVQPLVPQGGLPGMAIAGTRATTDASGRVYLDLVRGATVTIQISRPYKSGSLRKLVTSYSFTVPDAESWQISETSS